MEAPPTTVQKPATTQDAVLGLAPSTRSAGAVSYTHLRAHETPEHVLWRGVD